jgi:FkbM family methyltransferase
MIGEIIKNILPLFSLKHKKAFLEILLNERSLVAFDENVNECYSQEGEDLFVKRYFPKKTNGFFVDIGAHHPIKFSNTFLLYQRGWRGINIDPNLENIKEFERIRPEDINLPIGISDKEDILTYYMFNEPALNTFDKTEADKKNGLEHYRLIGSQQIQMKRLDSILEVHVKNHEIDLLTIDVESIEIKVLKSNNWKKHIPKLILIEQLEASIEELSKSEVYCFLTEKGYKLISKLQNTSIYIHKI